MAAEIDLDDDDLDDQRMRSNWQRARLHQELGGYASRGTPPLFLRKNVILKGMGCEIV